MKRAALLLFFMSCAQAQSTQEREAGCRFVSAWANHAYHIARTLGLEERNWHIAEDEFDAPTLALIKEIKREAYHDMPALRTRVEKACGNEKEM